MRNRFPKSSRKVAAALGSSALFLLTAFTPVASATNSIGGSLVSTVSTSAKPSAVPTSAKMTVNGKTVSLAAFNLGGYHYCRIRDLATVLNATSKSFAVTWDVTSGTTHLQSNEAYLPVGGELTAVDTATQAAETVTAKVTLNGTAVALSAYQIGSSTYFKLADVAKLIGFTANWDAAANTVDITTNVPWVPVTSIDFSAKHDVMIQNADGTLTPMDTPYFQSKLVAPGTWQILSDGDYCYLVEGEDEAIMIDCGYGAGNIRAYCQTLTTKPLKYVINTHYHFDHTANDAYFDCAYMATETVDKATIPYASFSGINFPRDYPIVTVGDGYTFDLGDRTLEVLEIPNHTVGGIALLDRTERILFSGDEIMRADSASLNCSVTQFAQNMSNLKAHRSEFDQCFGGPGIVDASAVDNFYATAEYILSGKGTPETPKPYTGAKPQTTSSASDSSQVVYIRKSVRAGDGGAPSGTAATMVQMTYNGCTLTYDSTKIPSES